MSPPTSFPAVPFALLPGPPSSPPPRILPPPRSSPPPLPPGSRCRGVLASRCAGGGVSQGVSRGDLGRAEGGREGATKGVRGCRSGHPSPAAVGGPFPGEDGGSGGDVFSFHLSLAVAARLQVRTWAPRASAGPSLRTASPLTQSPDFSDPTLPTPPLVAFGGPSPRPPPLVLRPVVPAPRPPPLGSRSPHFCPPLMPVLQPQ